MNAAADTGRVPSRWRDRAACLGEDAELFFPVGTDGPALLQTAEAKAVCRRCSVVTECLETALAAGDGGVRGGLSEDERAALSRARARVLRRARRGERAS
jgi:WhiB family transcriptional regulator, redox-sensing transcriptional regulator